MFEYVATIDGMVCEMCEAHINETIRNNFNVKKVKANRKKKEARFLSEETITEEKLRNVIAAIGYTVESLEQKPYQKKGLFW